MISAAALGSIGAWAWRNRRALRLAAAAVAGLVAVLVWRGDLIDEGRQRAETEAKEANDATIDAARRARDDAMRGGAGGVFPDDGYQRE